MKNLVINEIKRSLKYLNYEFENRDINVSVPKNKEFGDLSTNIAFLLSKKNKKNPIEISTSIKENLISVNLLLMVQQSSTVNVDQDTTLIFQ